MSARRVALTLRCLEFCFIWNGSAGGSRVVSVPQWYLQILPLSRENPSYRVKPLRGENPCNVVWLDVAFEWGICQLRNYAVGALRGRNPINRA